jgi:tetratricopeptide (TPR) repeat protein
MKIVSMLFAWLLALVVSGLQTQAQPANRFDMLVRADFFAGFAGDAVRLTRAMETCERALAENPRNAEAMVWHGSGLMAQAGMAFSRNEPARGAELWGRGLAETDAAVALSPNDVGVLIPRGAVLLQATRMMPPDVARPLIESALHNYERVLEIQHNFQSLGDHPKGELLFGLAEGYARLGDTARARTYFERLVSDAPGSGQTPRARTWLETGSLPPLNGMTCVGCHK